MLILVAWVLVVSGVAIHAARYPRWPWQPVIIVATFAGVAPVATAVGALLLALADRAGEATFALLLTGVMAAIQMRPFVPWAIRGGGPHPDRPALTVMTHNLWMGRGDADAILVAARAADADVLCLQEVTEASVAALRAAGIDDDYPHSALAPAPDWNGAALWSRLPLRDVQISARGTLLRVEAVAMLGDVPAPARMRRHRPGRDGGRPFPVICASHPSQQSTTCCLAA